VLASARATGKPPAPSPIVANGRPERVNFVRTNAVHRTWERALRRLADGYRRALEPGVSTLQASRAV